MWDGFGDDGRMVNVRSVDRDQQWLMPPSLSDWLPADHLAWFVVDVVAELDLSGFYRVMRPDGRGGACYDPGLMVAVLFYAYIALGSGRRGGSNGGYLRMWRFGWWRRIRLRITPRWRGSVALIRTRSARCSLRCWGCAPLRG
jgi:hypothetical protein